ncbi:MAG: TetR family transcriptional regulator [Pseudomonadota bacterium]
MTEAPFMRARSAEQKAQRAEAILSAAAHVLDRDGIEGATLAAIAAEAGVVKSGLYRYYESREDVLMHLLAQDAVLLIDRVAAAYAALPQRNDFAAMGRIFAAECAALPRFGLLISQMASVLEQNVSPARIIEIKRGFLAHMGRMVEALVTAAPSIARADAVFLVNALTHLVAGLWPVTHPAPAVAEALEAPDLEPFRIEFQDQLARSATALIRGMAGR